MLNKQKQKIALFFFALFALCARFEVKKGGCVLPTRTRVYLVAAKRKRLKKRDWQPVTSQHPVGDAWHVIISRILVFFLIALFACWCDFKERERKRERPDLPLIFLHLLHIPNYMRVFPLLSVYCCTDELVNCSACFRSTGWRIYFFRSVLFAQFKGIAFCCLIVLFVSRYFCFSFFRPLFSYLFYFVLLADHVSPPQLLEQRRIATCAMSSILLRQVCHPPQIPRQPTGASVLLTWIK